MSQPLGLTPTQELAYVRYLFSSHDFAISLDLLQLDHTPIRSLTDTTMDGQINLQRDSAISRTATFTFDDPEHSLHLDADSPWQAGNYVDRMIQVRHQVTVPGVGQVTAIPFVGPISKVSRDGDQLQVECQDKAALAITGCTPVTVKKGHDAVDAIRYVMRNGAGETRFRLPNGVKRNLHKSYSAGWQEDAAPWVVCQRIARQLNMQLLYSCDGYLTLRPYPSHVSLGDTSGKTLLTQAVVTTPPQVDFDSSQVANMVRVTGTISPPARKNKNKQAGPSSVQPTTSVDAVAVAAPNHPLSPNRLGRNGVARYLPVIIEGATYKSVAQARALAVQTLADDLKLTTGLSFDMVPVFHLDVGDMLRVTTDAGTVQLRLEEGSIPLAVSGDMSVGYQRRVSGAPGRFRVHARHYMTKAQRKAFHKAKAAARKAHHHHG
jgi:hypothetical protein